MGYECNPNESFGSLVTPGLPKAHKIRVDAGYSSLGNGWVPIWAKGGEGGRGKYPELLTV